MAQQRDKTNSRSGLRTKEGKDISERVRDIFSFLARAASTQKLFPAHHETVIHFRDELFARLKKFLDEHGELDIRIKENVFTHENEIIYQDENILKSLPYLFFKDGMKKLTFLSGLNKEELQDFLDIIKKVSFLPPDVGDIVDALWQRDLEHIRFFAPNDFLESKITRRQNVVLGFSVDKDKLYKGKITLAPEDREDIFKKTQAMRVNEQKDSYEPADIAASLDKRDTGLLDSLLSFERRIPVEKDFLDMAFELLYLEDRIEPFKSVLAYLERHNADMIQKTRFAHAVLLLNKLTELAQILLPQSPDRANELEKSLQKMKDSGSLDKLREIAREELVRDPQSFFMYLKLLGPHTLPLAAGLIEDIHELEFRSAGLKFLQDLGQENVELLGHLAEEHKPFLTKAIIAILGQKHDKKIISLLIPFLDYRDKEIKIKAVKALGIFSDSLACKNLLRFLRDPDEDIRIQAALNIRIGQDQDLVHQIILLSSEKAFKRKSRAEKEAVLNILGKSRTEEASAFLRLWLQKFSFLRKARMKEIQLGAVQALELMATLSAMEALKAGARRGNKDVKKACQAALDRLAPRKPTNSRKS
jgi:HEAT repeat protein